MIRFGPGGFPLSTKGRALQDGVEDVHTIGLTAMEYQFLRGNIIEREVLKEEINRTPRELEHQFILSIIRKTARGKSELIVDPDEPVRKKDVVKAILNPPAKHYKELVLVGNLAKNLDIALSIHAPYYVDFVENGPLTEKCIENIKYSAIFADQFGGSIVVTHVGFYGTLPKEDAYSRIKSNFESLLQWWKELKIKPRLGIETSGRQELFGSLDDVIRLCSDMNSPLVIPVLNFAHLHARGNGLFKKKDDFQFAIDTVIKYIPEKNLYVNFSGVDYENGNELRLTPIKKGDMKFESLADTLLDNAYDATIICSSPLLEHDAMYMKMVFEKLLIKRETRQLKKGKEVPEEIEKKKIVKKKPVAKKPIKPKKKPLEKKTKIKKTRKK